MWQDWHVSKIEVISVSGYKEMDERDSPYYSKSNRWDMGDPIIDIVASTTSKEIISQMYQCVEIADERPEGQKIRGYGYRIRVSFEESESIVWEGDVVVYQIDRENIGYMIMRTKPYAENEGHTSSHTGTTFTQMILLGTPLYDFLFEARP